MRANYEPTKSAFVKGCIFAVLLLLSSVSLAQNSHNRANRGPVPSLNQGEDGQLSDVGAAAYRQELRKLFDQSDYAQLEKLATAARSYKVRFYGGGWQLHEFVNALCCVPSDTGTDADWAAHFERFQKWTEAFPQSDLPRTLEAEGYLHYAWRARGNGSAETVTAEGWRLFGERAGKAKKILEGGAEIGASDPQWYRAMELVALAEGWPRKKVDALTASGLKLEPGYYYLATAEANFLLPKWYGRPGDTESFAAQVADQVGGREGEILYYQVAVSMNCCKRMQAPRMDWQRVVRGFDEVDARYKTTYRQRNEMAFLALRAGDSELANELFERIGDKWDRSIWKTKERFDASRTGQPVGDAKPVAPYNAKNHTETEQ